jgi:hypothetical protein
LFRFFYLGNTIEFQAVIFVLLKISLDNLQLFYYRYWLCFDISDHTTSTTCTIFDAEAKKIIGTGISELLDSLEENTEDVPKVIPNLYGKVFIFHFKLNDSNLVDGRQGFLVNKTYVPDDNLERKINCIDATEVSFILHNVVYLLFYIFIEIENFFVIGYTTGCTG